jgi:TAG lipase/steryl ester hydrolase/phospholipase A2/LPA acyltransferase
MVHNDFLAGTRTLAPGLLRQQLVMQMSDCKTYQEWRALAVQVDALDGYDRWKMRFESTEYDYLLIRDLLEDLYTARKELNVQRALFLLRTNLRRNIGNVTGDDLYQCQTGTKDLVQQYTDEVVYQLRALAKAQIPGLSEAEKIHELVYLRQAYGRSALVLSGGGGLGVYHMGVIKALFEAGMLPRVISGSSAGSIVGAILCSYTDAEIADFCKHEVPPLKSPYFFNRADHTPSAKERIIHLIQYGSILLVLVVVLTAFPGPVCCATLRS